MVSGQQSLWHDSLEDQVATLQREYIEAAQEMAMLARRIERIGGDGNG